MSFKKVLLEVRKYLVDLFHIEFKLSLPLTTLDIMALLEWVTEYGSNLRPVTVIENCNFLS